MLRALCALDYTAVRSARALHTTSRAAAGYGLRRDGEPSGSTPEGSTSTSAETGAAETPSTSSAEIESPWSSLSTPAQESSTSSSPSSSSAPSTSASTQTDMSDLSIDALWDRVIRTPSAVLGEGTPERPTLKTFLDKTLRPRYSAKYAFSPSAALNSPGDHPAPSPRMRRALGQTRAEGARFDDALGRLFQEINDRTLRPQQGARWSDMVRQPVSSRREDEDPQLAAEVDAKVEALSVISTPAEVVAWAEDNVFTTDGKRFSRTYPRLLAAVMRHLRSLNAPHLSLAMFAHARSLGLESYLAGCQTSTFNQLLRTRWDSFRDLAGVVDAVGEMERTGVAWDKHTKVLVAGVVEFAGRELLARRSHGWGGQDAYQLVNQLENRLEADSRRENRVFERKLAEKRAVRQTRRDGGRRDRDQEWAPRSEGRERGDRGDRGEWF